MAAAAPPAIEPTDEHPIIEPVEEEEKPRTEEEKRKAAEILGADYTRKANVDDAIAVLKSYDFDKYKITDVRKGDISGKVTAIVDTKRPIPKMVGKQREFVLSGIKDILKNKGVEGLIAYADSEIAPVINQLDAGVRQLRAQEKRTADLEAELDKTKKELVALGQLPQQAAIMLHEVKQSIKDGQANHALMIAELERGNQIAIIQREKATRTDPIKYKLKILELDKKGALTEHEIAELRKTREEIEQDIKLIEAKGRTKNRPAVDQYRAKVVQQLKELSIKALEKYENLKQLGAINQQGFKRMSAKNKKAILEGLKF